MIALKVLSEMLLCLSMVPFGSSYGKKDSFPKIHDVISFKRPTQRLPNVDIESDITIDIEKLDIQKLKKDDSAFRRELMGDLGGDILLGNKDETRRVQQFFGNMPEYTKAYEMQYRSKMADCMLQLIYMARSKIRSFQSQGNVKQDSSEYRVGFIIRKLEMLYFRARRLYTIMVMRQEQGKWNTESAGILNLHHKVVMYHYEFDRFFFVQMKLHEKLELIEGRPIHSTAEATSAAAVAAHYIYRRQE